MVRKPIHSRNGRQLAQWRANSVSGLGKRHRSLPSSLGRAVPAARPTEHLPFQGRAFFTAPCLCEFCPCGIPVRRANCAPIKEDWRTHSSWAACVLGLPLMGLYQAGRSSVRRGSCGKSTQEQIKLTQQIRRQKTTVKCVFFLPTALKTIKSWMVAKFFPLLPS